MKKLLKILVLALVLVSIGIVGCENKSNENIITNDVGAVNYGKLNKDTLKIKKELFSALDYFKDKKCSYDLDTKINDYLSYRNIKQNKKCDFAQTEKYLSEIDSLNAEEKLDYLKQNKYISEEAYDILAEYSEELTKGTDYKKIINKYYRKIEKDSKIEKEEKNKLLLGLNISKYTYEYFGKTKQKVDVQDV